MISHICSFSSCLTILASHHLSYISCSLSNPIHVLSRALSSLPSLVPHLVSSSKFLSLVFLFSSLPLPITSHTFLPLYLILMLSRTLPFLPSRNSSSSVSSSKFIYLVFLLSSLPLFIPITSHTFLSHFLISFFLEPYLFFPLVIPHLLSHQNLYLLFSFSLPPSLPITSHTFTLPYLMLSRTLNFLPSSNPSPKLTSRTYLLSNLFPLSGQSNLGSTSSSVAPLSCLFVLCMTVIPSKTP